MESRIETLIEKKVIGKRMRMSLSNNKTLELWQSFMMRRKDVKNIITTDLLSIQIYESNNLNFEVEFEKWAAVEVANFDAVPNQMETYILCGGLYAVFIHKGAATTAAKTFQYIFEVWLPISDYLLDSRPHFEILGEKYKNGDPTSEEEVWIPIKMKAIS